MLEVAEVPMAEAKVKDLAHAKTILLPSSHCPRANAFETEVHNTLCNPRAGLDNGPAGGDGCYGTPALLIALARFDTPRLTHFDITGAHGDQIAMLFNATQRQSVRELDIPSVDLTCVHPPNGVSSFGSLAVFEDRNRAPTRGTRGKRVHGPAKYRALETYPSRDAPDFQAIRELVSAGILGVLVELLRVHGIINTMVDSRKPLRTNITLIFKPFWRALTCGAYTSNCFSD
ncbi:hypothetical protein FB45DRAFT_1079266 [Roridomyces roridus]|uniref:Uncharacterized protein n=1 Tax=Roridomyces roridus TaxID=1738132 RepID=A0AAD7FM38_9AGAR|nr:hypothetical protein FB45DRAFT_1079266 [Roridomyces roridus]